MKIKCLVLMSPRNLLSNRFKSPLFCGNKGWHKTFVMKKKNVQKIEKARSI